MIENVLYFCSLFAELVASMPKSTVQRPGALEFINVTYFRPRRPFSAAPRPPVAQGQAPGQQEQVAAPVEEQQVVASSSLAQLQVMGAVTVAEEMRQRQGKQEEHFMDRIKQWETASQGSARRWWFWSKCLS